MRLMSRFAHSIRRRLAGGVTDVGVGSGAWLGCLALNVGIRNMDLGFGVLPSHAKRANRLQAITVFECTLGAGRRSFLYH